MKQFGPKLNRTAQPKFNGRRQYLPKTYFGLISGPLGQHFFLKPCTWLKLAPQKKKKEKGKKEENIRANIIRSSNSQHIDRAIISTYTYKPLVSLTPNRVPTKLGFAELPPPHSDLTSATSTFATMATQMSKKRKVSPATLFVSRENTRKFYLRFN